MTEAIEYDFYVDKTKQRLEHSRILAMIISFSAILLCTIAVSIPTFLFDDADDAFFVEVAHRWVQGAPPYIASFDVKGPGFFAILAFAESLLGPTLATLKIVSIVSSAFAATLLYRICEKYNRPAAITCAALYPILTIISGDAAYQVMNAFLLVAFSTAFVARPNRMQWTCGGFAIGVACMIKQTCAFDALALASILFLIKERDNKIRLRAFIVFCVSAAIPALAVMTYYFQRGGLGALIQDVVVTALRREVDASPLSIAKSFVEWMLPLIVVVTTLGVALFDWKKISTRFPVKIAAIWLGVGIFSVIVQRAGCRPYIMPMIAPMLLMSTIYVSERYASRGRSRQYLSLSIFGALTVCGAMVGHGDAVLTKMTAIDSDVQERVKSIIENSHPQKGDRLFVVNGPVWINILTHLDPPTPYFHFVHTMCDFPGAGLPALVGNFAAKPRFVVEMNPDKRLRCESDSYANEIASALESNYKLIATATSGRSTYQVFENSAFLGGAVQQ